MKALSKTNSRGSLPVAPAIANPSVDLQRALDRLRWEKHDYEQGPPYNGTAVFAKRGLPRPEIMAEAKALAHAFDEALRPADPEIVSLWLLPLAAGVRNPPSQTDFPVRAAAIAMACADLGACCFTVEKQREALSAFQFWPAAADVRKILVQEHDVVRSRQIDLIGIAHMRPIAELAGAKEEYQGRARYYYPTEARMAAEQFEEERRREEQQNRRQMHGGFE